MEEPSNLDRREFLRSLGRGVALSALALGGAGLLARSQGLCSYDFACGLCPIRSECRYSDAPGGAASRRPDSSPNSNPEDKRVG